MTPTYRVQQGNDLIIDLGMTSYVGTPVNVEYHLDVFLESFNAFVPLIPTTPLTVPGRFTTDPSWPSVRLGIPTGLPPVLFASTYKLVAWIVDPSTRQIMSVATTDFRLVP